MKKARPIRSYKNMEEYELAVRGKAALISLGLTGLIAVIAWVIVTRG